MKEIKDNLINISPLDGRYSQSVAALRDFFSEFALIRHRLQIEIRWLLYLADSPDFTALPAVPAELRTALLSLEQNFDLPAAQRIKEIEQECRHDLKAVELFLREKLEELSRSHSRQSDTARQLLHMREFIHFGCTSEDINNLCWALMLRDAQHQILHPQDQQLLGDLQRLVQQAAKMPMLARTHGQAATPTTMGKEIANFHFRLQNAQKSRCAVKILGKMNGAVGNYNAHLAACPEINWRELCRNFVLDLGILHSPMSAQVEARDWMAEWLHAQLRVNTILLDLCRDVWSYVSLGYFRQRTVRNEVGSSTMPHKLNPIDFENAEGNLGLANALLEHMAQKLPVSRWQRDLSDSTVLRNLGVAIGHSLLACTGICRGLQRLSPEAELMRSELDSHWEVLTEAVQTVMRRHGVENAYDKLKTLSRGENLERDSLHAFIESLPIPEEEQKRLLLMRPSDYTGLAAELATDPDPH